MAAVVRDLHFPKFRNPATTFHSLAPFHPPIDRNVPTNTCAPPLMAATSHPLPSKRSIEHPVTISPRTLCMNVFACHEPICDLTERVVL